MDNDKFIFNYDAKKAKEIKAISEKYLRALSSSYYEIKRLDKEAERPAKVWFAVLFVVGILSFGGGLSLVLTIEAFISGSLVGIAGIGLIIYSFRLKKGILEARRRAYGPKILALLEEDQ